MNEKTEQQKTTPSQPEAPQKPQNGQDGASKEIGGRGGLDPARYGDWEIGGKCVDF